MKTLRKILSLIFLNAIVLQNLFGLEYFISFSGTGQSSSVESVIARNISKGTQVTVPTGYDLRLFDVWTDVKPLSYETENVKLFPNPIVDKATLSVFVSKSNAGTIKIYTIDGRLIKAERVIYNEGINSFEISLPAGVFVIKNEGSDFKGEIKAISISLYQQEPSIKLTVKNDAIAIQKAQANNTVNLQYTSGDQMLFKGISGNYSTIVTDIPTESKTVKFDFIECKDADGNNYTVVKIGSQVWMAENLKTTKYNDGVSIPLVSSNTSWGTQTNGAYCWYNNDAATYKNLFGALYNWYAVNTGKLAPTGWRVASDADWITLNTYLMAEKGLMYDPNSVNNSNAKSLAIDTLWRKSDNSEAPGFDLKRNNASGFCAVGAGYRYNVNGSYGYGGEYAYWWCTDAYSATNAWRLQFSYNDAYVSRSKGSVKSIGHSVRCVKNE
jgi:uncharacterized protein (TIGR02145 family)